MLKIHAIFLSVIMMLSILPGCLDQSLLNSDDDDIDAPVEAMGLWWPNIDGVIEAGAEWSDSTMENINFQNCFVLACDSYPATLSYKSVDYGMALAIELDNVAETPQEIVVTFPDSDIELTSQINTLEEGNDNIPFFQTILSQNIPDNSEQTTFDPVLVDFLINNRIAIVHNLDDNSLVIEASAKGLFADTTKVTFSVEIVFKDATWEYGRTINFDWILPFLLPQTDLSITGIEVTQAVQTADMQMPLIKDKKSLARVYVDSDNLAVANVEVTLTRCFLFLFLPICTEEMSMYHVAVQNPDRNVFSESANFLLPDSWVSDDFLILIATVKPYNPLSKVTSNAFYVDPDKSNNYDTGVYELHTTHNLRVWVLPTREDASGDGIVGLVTRSQSTMDYWMDTTEAVFPVANLDVFYLPSILSPDFTGNTSKEIRNWLRTFDTALDGLAIWGTGESAYDQMFAARSSRAGGISDPLWGSGLSRVSTCGDRGSTSRQLCAAHEITHNLGPSNFSGDGSVFDGTDPGDEDWGIHLQCNAVSKSGGDQVWKNLYGSNDVDANVLDIGWDSNVPNPDTNINALIPSSYPDYMSYCMAGQGPVDDFGGTSTGNQATTSNSWNLPYITNQTKWISTYRYLHLYDQMINWDTSNAPYNAYYGGSSSDDAGRGQQGQTYNTLRVIRGTAPADGSNPTLSHSWTFGGTLTEALANAHGDNLSSWKYTILAKDASGDIIDTIHFSPSFEIHETDNVGDDYFSFYVQDNDQIDSIELLNEKNSMIDILSSSGNPVTQFHSLGTSEYNREESVEVSWDQANSNSERETMYQLEYSWGTNMWFPIGGMSSSTNQFFDFDTLPAGDDAKFRVRATNGFDTYRSESTAFSLPNQAPVLTLETSGALGLQSRWAEIGGTDSAISITRGDSFSIKPSVSDADFQPLNENGFSAVLKRDGETVWICWPTCSVNGDDNDWRAPNRITSWSWSNLCAEACVPFNFPNGDILPGEMTPGEYQFEMTYVDEAGASVTKTVSFEIVEPNYPTQDVLDDYRRDLVRPESDVDLNIYELHYYVALERIARDEEDALTDSELNNLRLLLGISEARAAELEQMRLDNSLKDLDLDLDGNNGDDNTLRDG